MLRKITQIPSIIFSQPLKIEEEKFNTILTNLADGVRLGMFLVPGFKTKISDISVESLPARQFTLTFSPTAEEKALCQEEVSFGFNNTTFNFLRSHEYPDLVEGAQAYLIFAYENGTITSLATNLTAINFRKLMLLSPDSAVFATSLYHTDYWIVDTATPENQNIYKKYFLSIFMSLSKPGLSLRNKASLAADCVFKVNQLVVDSSKSDEKEIVASRDQQARYAFKKAQQRKDAPYIGTFADFIDLVKSLEYCNQQLPIHLQTLGYLTDTGNASKKRVLFVGEGSSLHLLKLAGMDSTWDCFAIEARYPFYFKALTSLSTALDRIGLFDLEEFQEKYHFKEIFDLIIYANYNLLTNQTDFFAQLARLIKPTGEILIGRSVTQSDFIISNRSIATHLQDHFDTVELRGKIPHPTKPDAFTADFSFVRLLYSAKKPRLREEKTPLGSPLGRYITDLHAPQVADALSCPVLVKDLVQAQNQKFLAELRQSCAFVAEEKVDSSEEKEFMTTALQLLKTCVPDSQFTLVEGKIHCSGNLETIQAHAKILISASLTIEIIPPAHSLLLRGVISSNYTLIIQDPIKECIAKLKTLSTAHLRSATTSYS